MDWVERYIYAVVRHLPAKNRKDIEIELRSLIMDALDEKVQGRSPEEADILEVLKELGEPSKMARNYLSGGSYIVGPRFYALYMFIIKIALGATALGLTVAFIVQGVSHGVEALDFLKLGGQLISAFFGTIGFLTLMFAITERINPSLNGEAIDPNEPWNPKQLPQVPRDFEVVKPSEMIVGLLFTVIFLVLLNFYPQVFGYYSKVGNQFVSLIRSDVLSGYLPLINGLLGIGLIKLVLLLAEGRYRAHTFILEILGAAGFIALAIMMLSGASPVDVSLIADVQLKDTLLKTVNGVYRGILIIMLLAAAFDVVRYSYRWIRSGKAL